MDFLDTSNTKITSMYLILFNNGYEFLLIFSVVKKDFTWKTFLRYLLKWKET